MHSQSGRRQPPLDIYTLSSLFSYNSMDSAVDPSIDTVTNNEEGNARLGEAGDVTLEEEVKKLVGNVNSWWTGFSKRVRG